jgi:signal transduction histidine kinase
MDIIFKDIEILDKIIKDTLFFSKPIEINFVKGNINNLIESVVNKAAPLLNHLKIKSKLHLDAKLNEYPVNIDYEKMEFIVLNLIYNSMDALKNKKSRKYIKITTKLYKRNKNIKISVLDNGCGIATEILSNIFKPFYTTKSKGMGLGLANVERVVYLHKGKVEATSVLNKFTEFEIIIPC